MKKNIFLLIFIIFALVSCGNNYSKNTVKPEISKKTEIKVNTGTVKKVEVNILEEVPDDDIRKKTKYPINFSGIQEKYFNNNDDISLLISYINNMEFQGYISNKEKEYAEIIIKIGNEFIKQYSDKIKLKNKYKLNYLLEKMGDNYKILGNNKKSLKYYLKSSKIKSDRFKIYIKIGNLYQILGDVNNSKKNYDIAKNIIEDKKLIEFNNNINKKFKDSQIAYVNLGIIYNLLNDKEKSIFNFNYAENIIKNSEYVFINEYERNKDLYNLTKAKGLQK